MNEQDERARKALLAYFLENGLLLCNENAELPYLELAGGTWNAIISLIESGDVFYSRLYRNRVTYLSRALYFAMKPHRRRMQYLDATSLRLLEFLRAAGEANAEEMQAACLLEKKAQTKALNQLVCELLVTVSRRDVTIHETWCTFRYCIAEAWEHKQSGGANADEAEARHLLSRQLSEKQIQKLLIRESE